MGSGWVGVHSTRPVPLVPMELHLYRNPSVLLDLKVGKVCVQAKWPIEATTPRWMGC